MIVLKEIDDKKLIVNKKIITDEQTPCIIEIHDLNSSLELEFSTFSVWLSLLDGTWWIEENEENNIIDNITKERNKEQSNKNIKEHYNLINKRRFK